MEGTALKQKASRVLQLLELKALKARYNLFKPQILETKRIGGHPYVVLEFIQSASSPDERQAQAREARLLPWHFKILVRRLELAADGIWLRMDSSSDRGPDQLMVWVELNLRGEQVLSGAVAARSSALRFVRRSFWFGFVAIGLVLVVAVYAERVLKMGWQQTLAGLFALIAVVVLIQRPWRKGK